jgi:hypothetical protein
MQDFGRWLLRVAASVTTIILINVGVLEGQAPRTGAEASTAAGGLSGPITAWGDPDLQGIWTNSTITPLERPVRFAGREFMTEEEARALDAEETVRADRRSANRAADVDLAYNQFWWERGKTLSTRRTSLIVDPPDGRLPALTPEGQKRAAEVTARLRAEATGPEDRNLAERCVTRGAPKLPGGYNNNFQIVQTPSHVAIMQEMIHEVRIIPLDNRPHLPRTMAFWLGDSRGHWEGDTLVVETTNYHELSPYNSYNCCRGAGRNLRITERFRRIDANTIDHRFTVEDPTTFTRPYTVAVPMTKIDEPIFEYACHEGNYGMEGILRGARAQERRP